MIDDYTNKILYQLKSLNTQMKLSGYSNDPIIFVFILQLCLLAQIA